MTVNNTLGAAEAASPAKALPNASYAALRDQLGLSVPALS